MSNQTPRVIHSVFGGDPDMEELLELFVSEVPQRIATLEGAFQRKDWDALHRAAHQMKGAAGSYGFGELTPIAAAVETAAQRNEPEEQLRDLVESLVHACRLLRTGIPVF